MSTLKRIEEIMIPLAQYPSVRDDATLKEAVDVIESAQIEVAWRKSLPRVLLVFDANHVLVGYVRRRDIMRGLEPRHVVSRPLNYARKPFEVAVDFNLSELSYDHLVEDIQKQVRRRVHEVMRPIETTVGADDHVMKAIQEMVTLDINLIPVRKGKALVGIVRSVDLFQELATLIALGARRGG